MQKSISIIAALLAMATALKAQQSILDYSLPDSPDVVSFAASPANETAANLTDRNVLTFYQVENFAGEVAITIETAQPVVVKGYTLVSADDESADPKAFKLEYSDNGTIWTRIGTSIYSHAFEGRFSQSLFAHNSNAQAHTRHRIVISAVNGGTKLKIAECQIFGLPASLPIDLTQTKNVSASAAAANLLSNSLNSVFQENDSRTAEIIYSFDQPVSITGYSLITTTAADAANQIRSWEVAGSNDGATWKTLDVRTNKNVLSLTNNFQRYRIGNEAEKTNWSACADYMQAKMIDLFWRQRGSGYYLVHANNLEAGSKDLGFNYWWMAHTLDVFIDAYARTGNSDYKIKMRQIYNGMKYGQSNLKNGFFDDMEWMALACIRANEVEPAGLVNWKNEAIQLWNWIKLGWNDYHGGGIQWVDVQPDSKNACSNAPAIIVAARLYQLTGEQDYLDWALRIFDWMNAALILENGLVKDSYTNDTWIFTYNQGTWIGACLELYKITNGQQYFDAAMRTADYILNDPTKFSPYGILYNDEGGGDGGLFKGILMRYLSQWILSGKLDPEREERFINYFISNGKSLWQSALDFSAGIAGNAWFERTPRVSAESTAKGYESSIHLSATMLFELLDELERNGFITERGLAEGMESNVDQAYKHYRLNVTANNGGSAVEAARWQLFEHIGGSGIAKMQVENNPVIIISQQGNLLLRNTSDRKLQYNIFNMQGRKVSTGELIQTKEIKLNQGIYIVSVVDENHVYSQKTSIIF
ncbi:MAG: T9SS type A sorting domain-containing protein [Candidatus Symbiothrix sp.]|jgi:predicted alpha-1,6-mannanase (GH76 family)|nr:T9SS type A sorting domain-containing protein [Candidatus Symbiothrix sp.]